MTPTYRPDVDGLRAVAVLLVLLFHAGVTAIPGGFIGVDVFFVVSGYLITTIIDREARQGHFSYAAFYRRRILRLMPALFTVMAATTAVATVLLFPAELASYARSVIATTLSVANVFFWRENGGYFGGNVEEVPLLHAWSLAVEEQYYFIWPAIILAGRRWLSQRGLLWGTALLFLGSLVLSEVALRVTYGAAYYLLPTRMYELMVGSLLALAWEALPRFSGAVNDALSVVALAVVVAAGLLMSKATPFPGVAALVPALATGVLLLTGRDRMGIANRMLATRPFVFIGLLSYSLYLWHWPVIVFTRYVGTALTPPVITGIVAASIGLAWLSWRFVEVPFRKRGDLPFRTVFARGYALPGGALIAVAVATIAARGLPQRFDARILAMDAALATRPDVVRGACHSSVRQADAPPSPECTFGAAAGTPGLRRAFLVGDSHANHFTGFLAELAAPAGVQVQDYTLDGCLPVPGFSVADRDYFAQACQRRDSIAFAHLRAARFDYVILGGNWPSPRAFAARAAAGADGSEAELRGRFEARLVDAVGAIVESGAVPVILKAGARTRSGPKCPLVRARFDATATCESPRDSALLLDGAIDAAVRAAQARWPQLRVIDPKDAMCPGPRCLSEVDGVPLYRDDAHLNETGSHALGRAYLRQATNPFAPATGP